MVCADHDALNMTWKYLSLNMHAQISMFTLILHVREKQRLFRECVDAQAKRVL